MCVRERERERERQTDRQGESFMCACVCVCVFVKICMTRLSTSFLQGLWCWFGFLDGVSVTGSTGPRGKDLGCRVSTPSRDVAQWTLNHRTMII